MKRNSLHWCLALCTILFLFVGLFSVHNAYLEYLAVQQGRANMERYISRNYPLFRTQQKFIERKGKIQENLQEAYYKDARQNHEILEFLEKCQRNAERAIWIQLVLVSLGLFCGIKAFHLLDELYTNPLTSLSVALGNALQEDENNQRLPPCRLPLLNRISSRCNQLIEWKQRQGEIGRLALLEMKQTMQMVLDSFERPVFLLDPDDHTMVYNKPAESLVAQNGFADMVKRAYEEHLSFCQMGEKRYLLQEKELKGAGGYRLVLLQMEEQK